MYFRMKLRFLQHVNKTSCHTKQYVQQGNAHQLIFKVSELHGCACLYSVYCLDIELKST